MPKKLYYADPLAADYMAREFGVDYNTTRGILGDDNNYNTVISYHAKYYVRPDSYHIFEPKEDDLVDCTRWRNCPEQARQGWAELDEDDVLRDIEDLQIHKIIQRDNKPFFWPNSE